MAEKHYLRGSDPIGYARMILKWINKEDTSEIDLFIARAVLQYLCLSNLKDANVVFGEFLNLTRVNTKLVEFLQFLVKTLERDAYPLFKLLREKYAPSLQRDPTFDQYLSLIGKVFFGVEPPNQGGLGSIFSTLMKSFMEGE